MTDIEPGQMDIFDILEDDHPPEPKPEARLQNKVEVAPTAGLMPKRKNEKQKAEGLLIRLNEYHLDKKMVEKEFLEWVEETGIQIGDFFRIQDVKDYYKTKKGSDEE